jgi:hypothetical protein
MLPMPNQVQRRQTTLTKRVHGDLDAASAAETASTEPSLFRFDDAYIERRQAEITAARGTQPPPKHATTAGTACEFSEPITLYNNVKSESLRRCRAIHGATCSKAAWQDDFENCKDRNRKKAEVERLRGNAGELLK